MAKKLHHLEIHPGSPNDGKFHGATVEHHFEREMGHNSARGMYMDDPPTEKHMFGDDQGHDMLAHIANHMAIPEHKPEHDKANLEKMRSSENKFITEEEAE